MTVIDNAEVVRSVFAAAFAGDKQELFRLLKPGVEWQLLGLIPDQPTFYSGREEVWAYARSLYEELDDARAELTDVVEVGDQVVVRVHLQGRGRASGDALELELSMLIRLESGRVARADDYEDHDEALNDAELGRRTP